MNNLLVDVTAEEIESHKSEQGFMLFNFIHFSHTKKHKKLNRKNIITIPKQESHLQCRSDFSRCRVRVNVQRLARLVRCHRRDDGDVAVLRDRVDHVGIHRGHLAHKAQLLVHLTARKALAVLAGKTDALNDGWSTNLFFLGGGEILCFGIKTC